MATRLYATDYPGPREYLSTPVDRDNGFDIGDGGVITVDDFFSDLPGFGSLSTTRGDEPAGASQPRGVYSGSYPGNERHISGYFLSAPASASATISGTVTFNLWGSEQDTAMNITLVATLLALRADGSLAQIAQAQSSELGTSAGVRNFSAGATTTSLEKGDRLLLVVTLDAPAAGNSGFQSIFYFDGDTASAAGDSWVEVAQNLTFDTSTPAGSIYYLRDEASNIADQGAGVDEKALRTARGAAATTAVRATATGPTSGLIWTKANGGNTIEWYTPALEAATLSGKVKVKIRASASSSSARCAVWAELARVNGDGTGAVVWVAGLLGVGAIGTQEPELGTSEVSREAVLSGPDLAITEGQRLRLRIKMEDSYLAAPGPSASGFTATLHYDAPTGGGNGDSFIQLTQSVTESGHVSNVATLPLEAEGLAGVAFIAMGRRA